MSEEPIAVSVQILDKEYRISCVPAEQAGLRESARLLDERMREIRQSGRVLGADRIAVIAALNVTYELAKTRTDQTRGEQDFDQRLGALQKRLDDALAAQHQMDAQDETV